MQEEHSRFMLTCNNALTSDMERSRLTAEWDGMRQEFTKLLQGWDAMHVAQSQRDVQWANVQQVLRKFFEQHHFELAQMHEKHRQEVHEQLQ